MINRDELRQIAYDAQVIGDDDSLECFKNAILERAAVECDTDPLGSRLCGDLIRALKTQGN